MIRKVILILVLASVFVSWACSKEKKSVSFQLADMEATDAFVSASDFDSGLKSIPSDCDVFLKWPGLHAESNESYIVVKKEVLMDGSHIKSVEVVKDMYTSHPLVQLVLDEEGAVLFEKITTENIRKKLCIISDGKIITCAVIMSPITSGMIVVSGIDLEGAKTLRKSLKN